jgi:transposase
LRRRLKRFVPIAHRASRCSYARWLRRLAEKLIRRFAFVDGTSYYLARGDAEATDKDRLRLGKFVWRGSTAKEGLFHDNVGPSLYAAKQGQPVKVWGFLANGHLCIHVLPLADDGRSTHMNGKTYRDVLDSKAADWKRSCWPSRCPRRITLIQDHERCLRQDESLLTLRSHGLHSEERYPKSSPDFNAIENVWSLLRTYLEENAPAGQEGRSDFVRRLHGAVRHLNTTRRDELSHLCHNMKERADAVLKLKGARSKW